MKYHFQRATGGCYEEEAIQIAKCNLVDGRSQLEVNFIALQRVIGKAPNKLISIVCIAGPYRYWSYYLK